MERYPDEKVADLLKSRLPEWTLEQVYIVRTYDTGDWQRTTMLAGAIAYLGEKAFHHPDLFLSYPRLKVLLTTHDAGGITERDIALAEKIEEIATWKPDFEVFKEAKSWF
ncbi:4a-hydroxytetrahydrobiopterin dehydratase [Longimicrobium sp.]|uniref:4a-hydroxytetrahydrobiopterin dehydratase n=1 Tax=Longimicrobium sp. TaxID=2029185 RepID=UPI002B7F28C1|nr:4a-hydroxytetrahydrobiopterin dehydratase [Longimicrobium sp.]HSU15059.1 4a-hydroxytetrahydrobiopterin dehydratase [Longimicrobium sp.]